jgi:hypothetical protein
VGMELPDRPFVKARYQGNRPRARLAAGPNGDMASARRKPREAHCVRRRSSVGTLSEPLASGALRYNSAGEAWDLGLEPEVCRCRRRRVGPVLRTRDPSPLYSTPTQRRYVVRISGLKGNPSNTRTRPVARRTPVPGLPAANSRAPTTATPKRARRHHTPLPPLLPANSLAVQGPPPRALVSFVFCLGFRD